MRQRRDALRGRPTVVAERPDPLVVACNQWYALAQKELAIFQSYTGRTPLPNWIPKPTDYADEKNQRQIFCFFKQGENGRAYEVVIDKRNDVNTFIIYGNAEDKAKGLVGTDKRAVIKIFGKNAYDFVKPDDFIDRQKMIFKAVNALAKKEQLSVADQSALIKSLRLLEEECLNDIRANCDFHTNDHAIRISKDLVSEKKSHSPRKKKETPAEELGNQEFAEAQKKFDIAYKHASATIEKSLADCAALFTTFRQATKKDAKPHEVIEEIKQMEIEIISERGRPFDMKVSDAMVTGVRMVSAQMPLGEKTLPSTHRTGEDDLTKLSNNVTDFTGVYNPSTKTIEKRIAVDSHSSYCPINQKDGPLRVYYSYLAAKEKVLQLAREKFAANPGLAKAGIEIDLATITLLSPFTREGADRLARGKNSEFMQLKDTRTALRMLASDSDLFLKIDDANIPVRLKSNHINLPVNASGATLKAMEPKLQKEINARGFFEFTQKLQAEAKSLIAAKAKLDVNGQQLVNDIDEYFTSSPRSYEEIDAKTHRLEKLEALLRPAYNQWQQGLVRYAAGEVDKKYVEDFKKIVNTNNAALGEAYQEIIQAYEDDYHHSEFRRIKNVNLIFTLHQYLREHPDLDEPSRKKMVGMLHGLQAEQCYFNRYDNPPEQAYDFHVNYILANYSYGKLIELFCKSAEDRTSALRVKLLAHMMFNEIHRYPPDLLNPNDKEALNNYMKFAVELSASLENTRHNSEARGLQVKELFTIHGYNMKAGKLMAGLAKGVYESYEGVLKKSISTRDVLLTSVTQVKGSRLGLFGRNNRTNSKGDSAESTPLQSTRVSRAESTESSQGSPPRPGTTSPKEKPAVVEKKSDRVSPRGGPAIGSGRK